MQEAAEIKKVADAADVAPCGAEIKFQALCDCVCSMAWRLYAIGATVAPELRRLDDMTHWLISTQAPHLGVARQALLLHGNKTRKARHDRDVQCMNQILGSRLTG